MLCFISTFHLNITFSLVGPTNKTDATENDDSARNSADDDQLCTLTIATTSTGKPKSAISQIHECALHMRMNVEFEVLVLVFKSLLLVCKYKNLCSVPFC